MPRTERFSGWRTRALNPYVALALRLYIGGIFIYASMSKINFAAEFATNIANYQLVPFWAVNLLAITLPWAELLCGILLIIGVRSKAAVMSIAVMLAVFTIAIAITLIRDIPIGCGCFSSVEDPMQWTTVLRDLVWLAMALYIYAADSAFQLEKRFMMALKDVET